MESFLVCKQHKHHIPRWIRTAGVDRDSRGDWESRGDRIWAVSDTKMKQKIPFSQQRNPVFFSQWEHSAVDVTETWLGWRDMTSRGWRDVGDVTWLGWYEKRVSRSLTYLSSAASLSLKTGEIREGENLNPQDQVVLNDTRVTGMACIRCDCLNVFIEFWLYSTVC